MNKQTDPRHPLNQESISVCILTYKDAQLAAVYGLTDLLNTASQLHNKARDSQSASKVFRVECCGIEAISQTQISALSDNVLIIPPCLGSMPPESVPWTTSLPELHNKGTLICSICAGALYLAQSGLLDNRPATTHWSLANVFTDRYPQVKLDIDKLLIDDGDIVTAGGLMAWVDLGLRLVERFMGSSTMLATARYFLVDPGGREQRFYSSFSPSFNHGDAAVLKAQHWLQKHSTETITVPMMAQAACLEGRTFIRRFHAATRLNPSEYLQQLRVSKARELMEQTRQNVEEIAWQVGYEDASAFRRVFQKITGLTPRDYRKRFSSSQLS
ncbi:GlxA family transcriptional regulator [Parendozoicomonas sp. Alg238-R29]|uniref:GlxA family transcriptional regulator n=1 Tax=Parendozoicomonas sp. Alg238-R29 TaxID=2993446 RepID=UPI00248F24BD|nr:GlxA family transcriptional regulator [Parendozoicomonas sp. Alg238-R29]